MSIGRIIKQERRKMGWTQEILANKLNISRITLGKYERNEQIIDFEVFLKLLDLFEISADTFLERNKLLVKEDRELFFIKELRKNELLYKRVMKYPKLEIEKLKNLY
jgi:transcriptional regulator with XRE-family HTH domain